MPIKVFVKQIDLATFQAILDYYNARKPAGENPLERLDRSEGGFQIKLDGQPPSHNPNDHIQQLRWSRGSLVSAGYIGFTDNQETLLYKALLSALGDSGAVGIE